MNRSNLQIEVLREIIAELARSRYWLVRSWEKCKSINSGQKIDDDGYDDIEAYTSRFSRSSDLLIQKVFRAIDAVELENPGTLLDAVNRAAKRGLLNDIDDIRVIRETRNEISHEYISEELLEIFERIEEYTPKLLTIIDNTIVYCKKYLNEENLSDRK